MSIAKINNLLLFLSILFSNLCYAQKETNIWYFGKKTGIDFNKVPPQALTNSTLTFEEGGSVMCDATGKLLFYTNGLVVLNKNHVTMKNGLGLLGDLSSTNNTIILPLPNNDSIYYLFTVGSAAQANKGLRYNVINVKGDNGNGELIEKNTLLELDVYEKISGIQRCNNKEAWIVVRKWDTDEYHSYFLGASGVNSSPVISHTGTIIGANANNSIGALKFSNNGKKLVAAHAHENSFLELMDFDNLTGLISNPIIFKSTPAGSPLYFSLPYGVEFSPDNKLLYVSNNTFLDDGENSLYQFDITSNNATTIEASKRKIAVFTNNFSGALQIANDGKIYFALVGENYISVINNPNVYGLGCNFVEQAIFLGQNIIAPVRAGLPNFLQSYFNPLLSSYNFTINQGNCTNKNISFAITKVAGVDSVLWDFGDTQISKQLNPTHQYNSTGFFDVKLTVFYKGCSGASTDITTNKIWIADNENFLTDDIGICDVNNKKITANVNVEGATYLWNTGNTTTEITTNTPGKYWFRIDYNGCQSSDTINLSIKPKPTVYIGKDTSVCVTKPIVLSAGNFVNASYEWNTGELTKDIKINKPGVYFVKVTTNCEASDTVNVFAGDCGFFIPNAFTPNGNSINDKFGVATTFGAKNFHFVIYDRWGNTIFKTNDNTQKWDGTYKGKAMPIGSYLWRITYTTLKGISKIEQGTVMLIR